MDRDTILATIAALAAGLSDADRAAIAQQIAPPVTHPTPEFSDDEGIQIMRLSGAKKSEPEKSTGHRITAFVPNVHSLALSEEVQTALDIIRWCLSVPKLRPDSPRFNYYVSRWLVPEKIERAKENGTFDATTKDAGPIDPAWLHLIPAALVEYEKFAGQHCLKSCHDARNVTTYRKTPRDLFS